MQESPKCDRDLKRANAARKKAPGDVQPVNCTKMRSACNYVHMLYCTSFNHGGICVPHHAVSPSPPPEPILHPLASVRHLPHTHSVTDAGQGVCGVQIKGQALWSDGRSPGPEGACADPPSAPVSSSWIRMFAGRTPRADPLRAQRGSWQAVNPADGGVDQSHCVCWTVSP